EHALKGGVSQPELGRSLLLQPELLVSADGEIDCESNSDDRGGGDQSPGPQECEAARRSEKGAEAEARRKLPRNAFPGRALLKPLPQRAHLMEVCGGLAVPGRQPAFEFPRAGALRLEVAPEPRDQRVLVRVGQLLQQRRLVFDLVHVASLPSEMWRTRSVCSASRRLCVTMIIVKGRSRFSLRNQSTISLSVTSSRSDVGSSASNSAGSLMRARASTARRCSPEEISEG